MMEEAVVQSGVKQRTVEAGRGVAWWQESWTLFMKNPGIWLVFGVIIVVGFFVLALIPVLGGMVAAALFQVIAGGWMLSARKLDSGGALEVANLFAGFRDKLNSLIVLGALAIAATLVIGTVVGLMGGGAVLGMMMGGAARNSGGIMAGLAFGMLALLVGLALSFVVAMALWFAPALVVFRDLAPVDAMKASWSASLGSIAPFLVYGVIWIVAAVVASIPLGLGFFLLMPLTLLGAYCSYKDIFEGQ